MFRNTDTRKIISIYLKRKADTLRPILAYLSMRNKHLRVFSVAKWNKKSIFIWFHFRGTLREVKMAEWSNAAEKEILVLKGACVQPLIDIIIDNSVQ